MGPYAMPLIKVTASGNCAEPIYRVAADAPDDWLAQQPGFIHMIAPGIAQFYGVDAALATIDAARAARLPRPSISATYNAPSPEEARAWGYAPAPPLFQDEAQQQRLAVLAEIAARKHQ